MSLTPEQREAAIEAISWTETMEHGRLGSEVARAALDALLSEFVVLHRDDVTEAMEARIVDRDGAHSWRSNVEVADRLDVVRAPHHIEQRTIWTWVTHWEPITNKDVGPWTTQETP